MAYIRNMDRLRIPSYGEDTLSASRLEMDLNTLKDGQILIFLDDGLLVVRTVRSLYRIDAIRGLALIIEINKAPQEKQANWAKLMPYLTQLVGKEDRSLPNNLKDL